MTPGTVLFTLAIVVVVAAYVARSFRRAPDDLDRVIEDWIAREARLQLVQSPAQASNICPQCGRHVDTKHRFCRSCGALLPRKVKS
ncbi:MAG: zinc ribbon domain-containing protein [Anaerolineae bacterium]|nr:zinc ribbon domain-containing protein [Anaerolineae bacterium]